MKAATEVLKTGKKSLSTSSDEENKRNKFEKAKKQYPKIKGNKDVFCWTCHRSGNVATCSRCPRAFHLKCGHLEAAPEPSSKWVCPECDVIERANNPTSNVKVLSQMLGYVIERMKLVNGSEDFCEPVDTNKWHDYLDYVIKPMDIPKLVENVRQNVYSSTEAFLADFRWLLHDSYVYNSVHSAYTKTAKSMYAVAKQECEEIKNCADCYLHAYSLGENGWFIEPCSTPHILVWAQLSGFPYWPGKVMKQVGGDLVDVRFFGDHSRANVPVNSCFLYSRLMPCTVKKSHPKIADGIEEVEEHVKKLKSLYGAFYYAQYRTRYNPKDEVLTRKLQLPGFTGPNETPEFLKMVEDERASKMILDKDFYCEAKPMVTQKKSLIKRKTSELSPKEGPKRMLVQLSTPKGIKCAIMNLSGSDSDSSPKHLSEQKPESAVNANSGSSLSSSMNSIVKQGPTRRLRPSRKIPGVQGQNNLNSEADNEAMIKQVAATSPKELVDIYKSISPKKSNISIEDTGILQSIKRKLLTPSVNGGPAGNQPPPNAKEVEAIGLDMNLTDKSEQNGTSIEIHQDGSNGDSGISVVASSPGKNVSSKCEEPTPETKSQPESKPEMFDDEIDKKSCEVVREISSDGVSSSLDGAAEMSEGTASHKSGKGEDCEQGKSIEAIVEDSSDLVTQNEATRERSVKGNEVIVTKSNDDDCKSRPNVADEDKSEFKLKESKTKEGDILDLLNGDLSNLYDNLASQSSGNELVASSIVHIDESDSKEALPSTLTNADESDCTAEACSITIDPPVSNSCNETANEGGPPSSLTVVDEGGLSGEPPMTTNVVTDELEPLVRAEEPTVSIEKSAENQSYDSNSSALLAMSCEEPENEPLASPRGSTVVRETTSALPEGVNAINAAPQITSVDVGANNATSSSLPSSQIEPSENSMKSPKTTFLKDTKSHDDIPKVPKNTEEQVKLSPSCDSGANKSPEVQKPPTVIVFSNSTILESELKKKCAEKKEACKRSGNVDNVDKKSNKPVENVDEAAKSLSNQTTNLDQSQVTSGSATKNTAKRLNEEADSSFVTIASSMSLSHLPEDPSAARTLLAATNRQTAKRKSVDTSNVAMKKAKLKETNKPSVISGMPLPIVIKVEPEEIEDSHSASIAVAPKPSIKVVKLSNLMEHPPSEPIRSCNTPKHNMVPPFNPKRTMADVKALIEAKKQFISAKLKGDIFEMLDEIKAEYDSHIDLLSSVSDRYLQQFENTFETDKIKLYEDFKNKLRDQMDQQITEIKRKQWCANCGAEASFHCCWNHAYCGDKCQKEDWATHTLVCTQYSMSATDPYLKTSPRFQSLLEKQNQSGISKKITVSDLIDTPVSVTMQSSPPKAQVKKPKKMTGSTSYSHVPTLHIPDHSPPDLPRAAPSAKTYLAPVQRLNNGEQLGFDNVKRTYRLIPNNVNQKSVKVIGNPPRGSPLASYSGPVMRLGAPGRSFALVVGGDTPRSPAPSFNANKTYSSPSTSALLNRLPSKTVTVTKKVAFPVNRSPTIRVMEDNELATILNRNNLRDTYINASS